MSKAALRRTDVEVVEPTLESRTVAALVGPMTPANANAARSTPRELQQRLSYEFGAQTYPEPVVEKFSPGASMLIVLGGAALLWGVLAVGFNLAVH